MLSAILACLAFPAAMNSAQDELDQVVGQNRPPTLADMANLPYCRAFVKEVLRWRPVAVLGGLPHAPTKDDYYEGYLIPKGTAIIGNLW